MKQIATIILAAGQGIRMKSDKPKVIFKLAGKPMINRVVETANKINSDIVVIVVGYKKNLVTDIVPQKSKIIFVEQKEQNGTGHAVMMTEDNFKNFNGDIFVLCGDVPLLRHQTLEKMLRHHRKLNASCTLLTAIMDDALRYGRILRNENDSIKKIVEFKDATEAEKQIMEINTGIYCFDALSLFLALKRVNNNNIQKEYYLTDTVEIMKKEGKFVTSILLEDMIEASGVNSIEQLEKLESEYLKKADYYDK